MNKAELEQDCHRIRIITVTFDECFSDTWFDSLLCNAFRPIPRDFPALLGHSLWNIRTWQLQRVHQSSFNLLSPLVKALNHMANRDSLSPHPNTRNTNIFVLR